MSSIYGTIEQQEAYLLSGILCHNRTDNALVEDVLGIYPVGEWADPACKIAAETMAGMLSGGEVVDLVSLGCALRGKLQNAMSWAADLVNVNAHLGPSTARSSAESLHREYVKSLYRASLQEALHLADNPAAKPDEVEGILRDCLSRMSEVDLGSLDAQDQIADYFANLEAGEAQPVPTPWSNLDYALAGGVAPGELVIVGARPSVGKSALAINWAWHSAAVGGNVVMFSLEMSRKQVFDRIVAKLAHIDSRAFRGKMEPGHLARAHEAGKSMQGKRIYVDERGLVKPAEVRRVCRKLSKNAPLSLVVIDYLQLMTPDNVTGNREQDVSSISRAFKLLAKDLSVPVILLSQLNRECEKNGRKPMLSDLRESGAIEQDADTIMFLHTNKTEAEMAQKFNLPEALEVIIAKGRSTGKAEVGLMYDKACQNIYDMTSEDYATMKTAKKQVEDNGL